MARLILASASPRRVELLARLGLVADAVDPADVDEAWTPGERPGPHAARLAALKAATVATRHPDAIVLAADTVVAVGRRVLPKAETEAEARSCLALLSGRRHHVFTGVTVVCDGTARHRLSESLVTFKRFDAREIDAYLKTGEWHGKAGGYAIQGYAEAFVRSCAGSWSGIVGLPLFETRALLRSAGLDV